MTTDHLATAAKPSVPATGAPQASDEVPTAAPPRRSGRLGALFPLDDRGPAGRRGLLWATLAVLVGAAVSLGHVGPGVNTFNVLFAEDGTYFLTDAWNRTFFDAVLRPPQGYFVIVPRLLTEVASLVPIAWGPAVLTIEAAIVTALMAVMVYVVSGAHLHHTLARLVAAAPIVAIAVAENDGATASNNVATLQFAALYTLLWVVLWVPTRRRAQLVAVLVVLATAVTTLLSVLLLPLALLRLYSRRDRTSAAMAGGLLLGLAMNVAALTLNLTQRPPFLIPNYDPIWALRNAVEGLLPVAMFGYRPARGHSIVTIPHTVAVIAAVAILVAVAVVGLMRFTRPKWPLAAVLVLHALLLFCVPIMSSGSAEVRYFIAPELALFAAMAVVLVPRSAGAQPGLAVADPDSANPGSIARPAPPVAGRRARALAVTPLALLAVFVIVVSGLSYQMHGGRTESSPWDKLVSDARAICADTRLAAVNVYPLWHDKVPDRIPNGSHIPRVPAVGWPVRVPCNRLR